MRTSNPSATANPPSTVAAVAPTATGERAPTAAIVITARTSTNVGIWRTRATGGATGRTTPPSTPATSPHTVSGPASGTASRLAGNETSGTDPNTGISTGATPSWAPRVAPRLSRNHAGPGRRAAHHGPATAIPRHAAHDNANPTECTRNGSATSRTATAIASGRSPATGRPRNTASNEHAAIAHARRTDGSQRVIVPNSTSTDNAEANRACRGNRRNNGPASASTNATFSPDTTRRCESPEARNCAMTGSGASRVSPTRKPATTARSTGGIGKVPRRTALRAPFATRVSSESGGANATTASVSKAPTACRQRNRASKPSSGRNQPRSVTRSPASSTASLDAASPEACTTTVRPPASVPVPRAGVNRATRTRTRAANRVASGSSASEPLIVAFVRVRTGR